MVGTVILFGFLILALSLYQVQVVPQENSDIEFEHSQQIEGEFLDLRNAVLSASRTGAGRSTSVKLGTRYPQRTFALNPPPASGQLSTTDPRELRIENATVEGDGNVVVYWNNRTETDGAIAFDTRSLRYSPRYHEFRDGPDLVYEHSLVVAEFENTVLSRTGQTVVDSDNRIRLTALNGTVDESGIERTSLDPETLSQSRRSVTLNSTGTGPIVLELPTDVSTERAGDLESAWRDGLAEDDANVEDVTVAGGTVRVELNGTESYRLELGKVGLGTGTSAPDESTGYITNVSSTDGVAVAEVRDRFNNPVVGAEVEVDVENNGTADATLSTDESGRVEYEVDAVRDVEFHINEFEDVDRPWESVLFADLGAAGGVGGGESEANPNVNGVVFEGAEKVNNGWNLEFTNTGDTEQNITQFRLNYYNSNNQGGQVTDGDVRDGSAAGLVPFDVGGDRVPLDPPVSLSAAETKDLEIRGMQKANKNDWFIVTLDYDDGTRAQYFVSA
ncbi:Ig-like domain-containing protein [Halorubrum sp. N11]|uniref:Ig-like domain-containing protein n=1 Tax=Halorubrum sp. N11 TaxID=3402276 RepID=UPI003EBFDA22